MTIAVPLEAAWTLKSLSLSSLPFAPAVRDLVEFVEQFAPQPLSGTSVVAGELRAISLNLEGLEPEEFDLIRLNGRAFVPEVLEAVEEPADWQRVSGAALAFDGGCLNVARDGSGSFAFAWPDAVDIEVEASEDSLGDEVAVAKFPAGEALELRDFLLKWFPLADMRAPLYVAGNGHELTLADVDEIVAELEQDEDPTIGSAAVLKDGARLIRFLVEVVIAEKDDELEDLRTSVIAFAGPFAAEYAKLRGWPDGDLDPHHFDILEKAGARMVSFRRHEEPSAA